MKNVIILLFAFTFGHAQIKVSETKASEKIGEVKTMGTMYSEITKDGDIRTFTYRDDKFTQTDNYKSFTFKSGDLDTLYNLFTNFEGTEVGSEKTVELEDGGRLYFKYGKTFGKMFAEVIHFDKAGVGGKIRWLSDKQSKKLFGKS